MRNPLSGPAEDEPSARVGDVGNLNSSASSRPTSPAPAAAAAASAVRAPLPPTTAHVESSSRRRRRRLGPLHRCEEAIRNGDAQRLFELLIVEQQQDEVEDIAELFVPVFCSSSDAAAPTTLLHLAISSRNVAIVEVVVVAAAASNGASSCVFKPDAHGVTPLNLALRCLPEVVAPLLLSSNSGSSNIIDSDISSARAFLHDVIRFNTDNNNSFPHRVEIVSTLLASCSNKKKLLEADGSGVIALQVFNDCFESLPAEEATELYEVLMSSQEQQQVDSTGKKTHHFLLHPAARVLVLVVALVLHFLRFMSDFHLRGNGNVGGGNNTATNNSNDTARLSIATTPASDFPFIFRVVDLLAAPWITASEAATDADLETMLLARCLCVVFGFLVGALIFAFPLHILFLRSLLGLRMFGAEAVLKSLPPAVAASQQPHGHNDNDEQQQQRANRQRSEVNRLMRLIQGANSPSAIDTSASMIIAPASGSSGDVGLASSGTAAVVPISTEKTNSATVTTLAAARSGLHQHHRYHPFSDPTDVNSAHLAPLFTRRSLSAVASMFPSGVLDPQLVERRVQDEVLRLKLERQGKSSSQLDTLPPPDDGNNNEDDGSDEFFIDEERIAEEVQDQLSGEAEAAAMISSRNRFPLFVLGAWIGLFCGSYVYDAVVADYISSSSPSFGNATLTLVSTSISHSVAATHLFHASLYCVVLLLLCSIDTMLQALGHPVAAVTLHLTTSVLASPSKWLFRAGAAWSQSSLLRAILSPLLHIIVLGGLVVYHYFSSAASSGNDDDEISALVFDASHIFVLLFLATAVLFVDVVVLLQEWSAPNFQCLEATTEKQQQQQVQVQHLFYLPFVSVVRGNPFAWFLTVWLVAVVIDCAHVSWYLAASVDHLKASQIDVTEHSTMILAFIAAVLPLAAAAVCFFVGVWRNSVRARSSSSNSGSSSSGVLWAVRINQRQSHPRVRQYSSVERSEALEASPVAAAHADADERADKSSKSQNQPKQEHQASQRPSARAADRDVEMSEQEQRNSSPALRSLDKLLQEQRQYLASSNSQVSTEAAAPHNQQVAARRQHQNPQMTESKKIKKTTSFQLPADESLHTNADAREELRRRRADLLHGSVWHMALTGRASALNSALEVDPHLVHYLGGPGLLCVKCGSFEESLLLMQQPQQEQHHQPATVNVSFGDSMMATMPIAAAAEEQSLEDERRRALRHRQLQHEMDEQAQRSPEREFWSISLVGDESGGDDNVIGALENHNFFYSDAPAGYEVDGDYYGATLLHYAVFANSPACCAVLIAAGADMFSVRTRSGNLSAMDLARVMGRTGLARRMLSFARSSHPSAKNHG